MTKPWFVYLIECIDGSIYTGITVDLERRYQEHCTGDGARYTRAHPPLRLLGHERHPDRASASRAEYRIKQLTPKAKRAYALSLLETASTNHEQATVPASLSCPPGAQPPPALTGPTECDSHATHTARLGSP